MGESLHPCREFNVSKAILNIRTENRVPLLNRIAQSTLFVRRSGTLAFHAVVNVMLGPYCWRSGSIIACLRGCGCVGWHFLALTLDGAGWKGDLGIGDGSEPVALDNKCVMDTPGGSEAALTQCS